MFARTFSIEQTKLMRRTLPWILMAVLAATAMLMTGINYLVMNNDLGRNLSPEMTAEVQRQVIWPDGLYSAISVAGGSAFGGLLVVILSGTTMAQEYTWRTLQQWLGRGVPRPVFLAAKFAALLLPILLMVVTPLLAGGALTALLTISIEGSLGAGEVAWGSLALSTLATAYTLLPYAALTFLIAVATRSTVAAVGIGVAYALLVEGLLVQLAGLFSESLARLSLYLPAGLAQSLLQSQQMVQVSRDGQAVAGGAELLSPGVAVAGIAAYTVLFLAVAIALFRRQDLNE